MRNLLGLYAVLFVTPALAASVLPLDGAYGNETGCHLFATGEAGEDMVLVTPDTALFADTGCDFESAAAEGTIYTVTGVCSMRGGPSRKGEILTLDWSNGQVTVLGGVSETGPLLPCLTVVDDGVDA